MDFGVETLDKALNVLGQLLSDRGQFYEVVAIGGGGLLLLGQIHRTTNDLDLVARFEDGELISADPLPIPLIQAINEVSVALNLRKDWIDTRPVGLFNMGLPEGFKDRLDSQRYGGLTIHLAGRLDQICFKLYAAADQVQDPSNKHSADLKFLKPTKTELEVAKRWCVTHDVSEGFYQELTAALSALGA